MRFTQLIAIICWIGCSISLGQDLCEFLVGGVVGRAQVIFLFMV